MRRGFQVSFNRTRGWTSVRSGLWGALLTVSVGDEYLFPFGVSIGDADRAIVKDLAEGALKRIMLCAGLTELESRLATGNHPSSTTKEIQSFLLTDFGVQGLVRNAQKQCRHRYEGYGGPGCRVAEKDKVLGDATTGQACDETCELPDSRILCSRLSHPMTHCHLEERFERTLMHALCDLRGSVTATEVKQCVPEARDCWVRVFALPGPEPSIPPDLADHVVDEIDYVNLAFVAKVKHRVIGFTQARAIADLGQPCRTEEEFMHRLSAVTGIVSEMDSAQLIPPERREELGAGSLNCLEAFLETDYPGFGAGIVRPLRKLQSIRNTYPVHFKTENVIADFAELGVDYPILDWQGAWQKTLCAFWKSLRGLRRLIQYGVSPGGPT